MVTFEIINKQIQYLINTRKFLQKEISLSECHDIIKKGMMYREENFLAYIKEIIYENKKSPYLEFLKLSHIDYEDIKKIVSRQGIEKTLTILKEEGVYITFEEFTGKKEAVRKGKRFKFKKEDFLNPFINRWGEAISGASRGRGTKIQFGVGFLMQRLVHEAIIFELHKIIDAPLALWYPPAPSVISLYPLRLQKLGILPKARFSQIKTRNENTSLLGETLSFLKDYAIRNFEGIKYPPAQYVSLGEAYIIAKWAAETIKEHTRCTIQTYVSSAVRICAIAKEKGLNITGTKFVLSSEPLTERKRKEIEDAGCKVLITYYFTEGGLAGCSCDNPENKTDEIHFFKDSFAVIQNTSEMTSDKINLFLFTSLYLGSPIVMLNMENGDYGIIEEKKCGCLFDEYSFFDHIYNIRSYEKITSEGMTFYTNDIVNAVEKEFPKEFGGSSIDYQVVEEENGDGLTRLYIYVNPEIKDIDEKKAKQILFNELNGGFKKYPA